MNLMVNGGYARFTCLDGEFEKPNPKTKPPRKNQDPNPKI